MIFWTMCMIRNLTTKTIIIKSCQIIINEIIYKILFPCKIIISIVSILCISKFLTFRPQVWIFDQIFEFPTTICEFLSKILNFRPNFWIFDQIFEFSTTVLNFGPNLWIFEQSFEFSTTILNFGPNVWIFDPICEFSTQLQEFYFRPYFWIFHQIIEIPNKIFNFWLYFWIHESIWTKVFSRNCFLSNIFLVYLEDDTPIEIRENEVKMEIGNRARQLSESQSIQSSASPQIHMNSSSPER
mgnify:CR=1 FL=1